MASFVITTNTASFEVQQGTYTREYPFNELIVQVNSEDVNSLELYNKRTQRVDYSIYTDTDTINVNGTTSWANAEELKTALETAIFSLEGGGGTPVDPVIETPFEELEHTRVGNVLNAILDYNAPKPDLSITKNDYEALEEYENRRYLVDDGSIFLGPKKLQDYNYVFGGSDLLVTTTGNDTTGDGSEGNPFATWEHAITTVGAAGGITIWVEGGSYNMDSGGGFASITGNFTDDVIIKAKPNEVVTLTHTLGTDAVVINGTSKNIVFEGLVFTGLAGDNSVFKASGADFVSEIESRDCTFNMVDSPYIFDFRHTGLCTLQKVKRCTINAGSGNGTCFFDASSNDSYIGNYYESTSTTASAFRVDLGLNDYYISNNTIVAENQTTSLSHQIFQFSSRMLSTGGTINLNRNYARKVGGRIFFTDGAAGVGRVQLFIKGNDFKSAGDRIIATTISVDGGEIMYNKLCCANVPLATPDEATPSVGQETENLEIAYNYVTSEDHTVLFGENGLNNYLHDNVLDSTNGLFGAVIKGGGHQIANNVLYGGSRNCIYFKNAENCLEWGDLLLQRVAGGQCLEYTEGSAFASRNNNTQYCFMESTKGAIIKAGEVLTPLGTGNVVDNNRYFVADQGTWGILFNPVSSLADMQAEWLANYPSNPNNDENSIDLS